MPFAVVALPAGLALFWALGAGIARLFWCEGWPRILVFAAAMTGAEWLRGHVLGGFPWNAFGYVLTPTALLMQSAAVVGLWGLTLAAFLVFAAPAALANEPAGTRRGRAGLLAFAALLLIIHSGFGAVRLFNAPAPDGGVPIRIVQPALDQSEKWQADNEDEIVDRYIRLSESGASADRRKPRLFIWPESAFPFLVADRPDVLSQIADLLPAGATLITGAARADVTATRDPADVYNSVLVIGDDGTIEAAYDKVHLVPFGEFVPLRSLFEVIGIRQLIAIPEGFSAGTRHLMLAVDGAPSFVPLICYEIIFPGAVVPPGPRPGWLLNVTNDTWFGDTPGPYQHFLQARVRAVEEGLPLVRAANSGISAIVDAYGRVVERLGLDVVGVVDGNIPEPAALTPYARFGDRIPGVLLAMLAAVALLVQVLGPKGRN